MTRLAIGMFLPCLAPGWPPSAEGPVRDSIPAAFRAALQPGEPFPLSPGWRWTYQRGGKDALFVETMPGRKVGGIATTRIRTSGDSFLWSRNALVAADGGALLGHGELVFQLKEHILQHEPPQVLLPGEYREDSFWRSASEHKASRSSERFTGTILHQEAIEVPAGKFKAWRIDYVLEDHLGTEHDLRTWYVPGIGFVKLVKWRESVGGAVQQKIPLAEPVVHELARVEAIADAHPIDFPSELIPLEKLPAHIAAPDGQVTLFADYGDRWLGGVVVYLVNRAPGVVTLTLHGGVEPHLWFETKGADGRWRRARKQDLWCHDLTGPLEIGPDTFVLLLGWQAEKGEEREVRYRLRERNRVLVSNAGRGLVDPEQVRLARYDVVSMEEAGGDLVREVLFDDIRLSEEERTEAQRWAMARLGKLSPEEVLPILEKVFASEALLRAHFQDAGQAFAEKAPGPFQAWVTRVLTGGPAPIRHLLLRESSLLEKGNQAEVREILLRQLEDPRAPDLRLVMSYLGRLRLPGVRDLLGRIARSREYPEELRIAAEYEQASWFGERLIDLGLEVPRSDRASPPVPIVVTLTNTGEKVLEFSYALESEIIGLYLEETHGPDRFDKHFLKPKPGVIWFQKAGGSEKKTEKTRVKLLRGDSCGDSHEVAMNLLDYFELPPDYDPESWYLTLWVTCSLPGIHQIPQSGSWGSSIRIHIRK